MNKRVIETENMFLIKNICYFSLVEDQLNLIIDDISYPVYSYALQDCSYRGSFTTLENFSQLRIFTESSRLTEKSIRFELKTTQEYKVKYLFNSSNIYPDVDCSKYIILKLLNFLQKIEFVRVDTPEIYLARTSRVDKNRNKINL